MKNVWNDSTIGNLKGKIVVITGATSGIGKAAALVMATKQAEVVIAVRNVSKGEQVVAEAKKANPEAKISVRKLDLSDLKSVTACAEGLKKDYQRIDVLINNAGVMMCPLSRTAEGFEMQFGTNHLGHFAFTGNLLPLLGKGSRVVVVSSLVHRRGRLDLGDLNWEKRKYDPSKAYFDSKLANLYFTYELAKKLEAKGVRVTAAHPGWTATDLQKHTPTFKFLNKFFGQGPQDGALPTLRAAFDDDAKSGDYFGPSRHFEMHGNPIKVQSNKLSHDVGIGRALWERSESLTGVHYPS
ncbi:MAG: oxidoreductase [Bdellovibrionota bacterium]